MATNNTKQKILAVAINLVRTKGFEATRIDDICTAANISKGAFFHHFKNKEQLGQQAAKFFSDFAETLFENAGYRKHKTPWERIIGYLDFRESILRGQTNEFTCYLGTTIQEVHLTHPELREQCREHIWTHAATLEADLQQLIDESNRPDLNAHDLALHTHAVLQGAFILAKAAQDPKLAQSSVQHLKTYFQLLFPNQSQSMEIQFT
jgi:TetR/AcrR family transcriptional repressor of nem operon